MSKKPGSAPENLGGTAIKPVGWDRTGMEAFKYFLYNPDTGEILSRTPLSWLKIIVFYTIYYTCLAAFWLTCLFIFGLTLPEVTGGPKYVLTSSLIGDNPGLGIRPSQPDYNIDSQMFVLKKGDSSGYNHAYINNLEDFLKEYLKPATGQYKNFDIFGQLGECGEYPFGFLGENVSPCIIIKLNKIWGWEPYPIDEYDVEFGILPTALEDHWKTYNDKNNVWINCEGRNPADKEALQDIEYFPKSRGFHLSYFPFMGGAEVSDTLNYHSPLVAVKINPRGPAIAGQLIHIECRAYYKGVWHSTKDKAGLVQFEVLISE